MNNTKSTTMFWFAIAMQCAGAIALNIFYTDEQRYSAARSASAQDATVTEIPTTVGAKRYTPDAIEAAQRASTTMPSDALGVTELMQSIVQGDCARTRQLINEGADVNAVNANGTSALIYAASGGDIECVRHLITAGAQVDVVDNAGDSALSAAEQQKFADIVDLLKRARR